MCRLPAASGRPTNMEWMKSAVRAKPWSVTRLTPLPSSRASRTRKIAEPSGGLRTTPISNGSKVNPVRPQSTCGRESGARARRCSSSTLTSSGRELLAFGHAIRRPDVELRILTSVLGLKKKDALGHSSVDSGRKLQRIVNETFDDYPRKPKIRILTGKQPPIHDRFLVVDGAAWLSGNSLNTLGERAGMIVKLPDPEPAVVRLEAFWRQASSLSDWLCKQPAGSGTT